MTKRVRANPEYMERQRQRTRRWRADNRERVAESNRRWYTANKHKAVQAMRRQNLKDRYGLTLDEYDRMYDSQEGKCAICKRVGGTSRMERLHVDHSHETGQIRGLLCFRCNTGIGMLGDTVDALSRAVAYLQGDDSR